MQLQLRAHDDNRTARIIDALAEQVLAETALLALQHVGKRFQRTLVGAGDDAATTTVFEERIDRFLKHALFVADDYVGRSRVNQPLKQLVAVGAATAAKVRVGGKAVPLSKRTNGNRH